MRQIHYIAFHYSASDLAVHDNLKALKFWHMIENGWSDVGYHYIITKSTGIDFGRPIRIQGAGIKDQNEGGIHICLTGKNEFTDKQFELAADICLELMDELGLTTADIYGHKEMDPTSKCPNYDVQVEIKDRIKELVYTRNLSRGIGGP